MSRWRTWTRFCKVTSGGRFWPAFCSQTAKMASVYWKDSGNTTGAIWGWSGIWWNFSGEDLRRMGRRAGGEPWICEESHQRRVFIKAWHWPLLSPTDHWKRYDGEHVHKLLPAAHVPRVYHARVFSTSGTSCIFSSRLGCLRPGVAAHPWRHSCAYETGSVGARIKHARWWTSGVIFGETCCKRAW